MLNMGFVEDIDSILAHVPENRKMLMFSATMPQEIARIAKKYMHDPEEFVIGNQESRRGQCQAHILHGQRARQILGA